MSFSKLEMAFTNFLVFCPCIIIDKKMQVTSSHHYSCHETKNAVLTYSGKEEFLARAAVQAGIAGEAGEIEKDNRYEEDVIAAGGIFFPLVVESLVRSLDT